MSIRELHNELIHTCTASSPPTSALSSWAKRIVAKERIPRDQIPRFVCKVLFPMIAGEELAMKEMAERNYEATPLPPSDWTIAPKLYLQVEVTSSDEGGNIAVPYLQNPIVAHKSWSPKFLGETICRILSLDDSNMSLTLKYADRPLQGDFLEDAGLSCSEFGNPPRIQAIMTPNGGQHCGYGGDAHAHCRSPSTTYPHHTTNKEEATTDQMHYPSSSGSHSSSSSSSSAMLQQQVEDLLFKKGQNEKNSTVLLERCTKAESALQQAEKAVARVAQNSDKLPTKYVNCVDTAWNFAEDRPLTPTEAILILGGLLTLPTQPQSGTTTPPTPTKPMCSSAHSTPHKTPSSSSHRGSSSPISSPPPPAATPTACPSTPSCVSPPATPDPASTPTGDRVFKSGVFLTLDKFASSLSGISEQLAKEQEIGSARDVIAQLKVATENVFNGIDCIVVGDNVTDKEREQIRLQRKALVKRAEQLLDQLQEEVSRCKVDTRQKKAAETPSKQPTTPKQTPQKAKRDPSTTFEEEEVVEIMCD
eukprot:TRINITY_DN61635_c0_g1_i2.p1 TRINITY_DN61635_c0_g1~~TRINITY_DN61635_c0_g1_i2.p1  ORF type:complete len:564 (-),score=68.61 TRINITY_DN61635_c0_g1_i2:763-2361(-)